MPIEHKGELAKKMVEFFKNNVLISIELIVKDHGIDRDSKIVGYGFNADHSMTAVIFSEHFNLLHKMDIHKDGIYLIDAVLEFDIVDHRTHYNIVDVDLISHVEPEPHHRKH